MDSATHEPGPRAATGKPQLRLTAYLSRWWDEMVHFNGPTWRSVKALWFCPGQLAAEDCDRAAEGSLGRRTVHPIRLFLTLNIIFFFVSPWFSTTPDEELQFNLWQMQHGPVLKAQPAFEPLLARRIELSGFDDTSYRVILDHNMSSQRGAVVFVFIPILGLAGFLAYRRRRPYLVEHLILGTHLTSFFLISMLVIGLGARLALWLPKNLAIFALPLFVLAWGIWLFLIFYRSIRAFHETQKIWLTTLLATWMFSTLLAGTLFYLYTLFFWTLFSLRALSLTGS